MPPTTPTALLVPPPFAARAWASTIPDSFRSGRPWREHLRQLACANTCAVSARKNLCRRAFKRLRLPVDRPFGNKDVVAGLHAVLGGDGPPGPDDRLYALWVMLHFTSVAEVGHPVAYRELLTVVGDVLSRCWRRALRLTADRVDRHFGLPARDLAGVLARDLPDWVGCVDMASARSDQGDALVLNVRS